MSPPLTQQVVNYCAQECEWQYSGEMSVAWMCDAWAFAWRCRKGPIMLSDVLALGAIVEPRQNLDGLRRVGVRVGLDVKMDWHLVPDALELLISRQPDLPTDDVTATEWFRQYEEIHPFLDGNGRTGTLLYNWLRGSLRQPVHVPNLWHDPRREFEAAARKIHTYGERKNSD